MDQFPETNNQPKVYILIPAELGKTYKFTTDCKIYRYLVTYNFFFNGFFLCELNFQL